MIKPANRNRLRAAIHAAGLLYAFGLAALLIANHFLRQASPFVALASTFNLYLFMAALPLAAGLPLCLVHTCCKQSGVKSVCLQLQSQERYPHWG